MGITKGKPVQDHGEKVYIIMCLLLTVYFFDVNLSLGNWL